MAKPNILSARATTSGCLRAGSPVYRGSRTFSPDGGALALPGSPVGEKSPGIHGLQEAYVRVTVANHHHFNVGAEAWKS